mmetsp:Transcript_21958/g.47604  ORF Transcript_21958/g.47604 Transcript_21958/m.47604 type:complete len:93 (-) Transcript_21958:1211-1489(-)
MTKDDLHLISKLLMESNQNGNALSTSVPAIRARTDEPAKVWDCMTVLPLDPSSRPPVLMTAPDRGNTPPPIAFPKVTASGSRSHASDKKRVP